LKRLKQFVDDSILRQLWRLAYIRLLLLQQSFPLLHKTFDHRSKQGVRDDNTSYHPVVRHDQTHPMQTNHSFRWDDVRRYFRKYGCSASANHHLRRLQEKFKQPFQVSFIVEVLEAIGRR